MSNPLPVILIEVVLVFGGVLAFGWWQLRSVARDRRETLARRAQAQPEQAAAHTSPAPAAGVAADATGVTNAQSITARNGTDKALP